MIRMWIGSRVRTSKHVNFARLNSRRQNFCLPAQKFREQATSPCNTSDPETTMQKLELKKPPDMILATEVAQRPPEFQDKRIFRRVLFNVNAMIEELSHMDEVRISQQKVIELKDKLFESGEKKRRILHALAEIRRDLKRVHADGVVVGRGTDGYLALVHNEIKLLKEEERLQATYDKADEDERNLFVSLTAAINNSYEKEKVHSNTLRLWGLIGTLFTSTITLILSTIGHYYHTTQLGLVGNKFKDTESVFNEIRSIRDLLNQMHLSKPVAVEQPAVATESWGAYLSRKTAGVYRYFFPKTQ